MPTDITIAFAGHAVNSRSNIDALLSDFLHLGAPDKDGYYEKPDRWGTLTFYVLAPEGELPAGLRPALNLALSIEGEDIELHLVTDKLTDDIKKMGDYADSVREVEDPLTEIVDLLSDSKRPYLFINWDEKDADDEHLINLAHRQGHITVSDLVEGLVEIHPDEEETEETPEPEPEEEDKPAPVRRRRKVKQELPEELDEEENDLEDTPASAPEKTETLEEDVAAAKREKDRTTQDTIAIGDVSVSSDLLRDVLKALDAAAFYMQALDSANATKNLADEVVHSPLTKELEAQSSRLYAALSPQEPYEESLRKAAPEKPKKKPTGKGTRVIWDEDAQEWKKAGRGRPRAGARTGSMDDDGNVTED